uniref:Sulfatase N-terminal domain-containing protein n=1 Tax=Ditylum brightwellii TaxID=49249 RepID=A0A6V2EEX6_9STRA
MKTLFFPCLLLSSTTAAADQKPNFIFIFMDDLGYGDVGFNGHPTTKTPNLDQLAFGGKILTSWYSGCNVCTGSRTSLMTGRQFPRTGMPGVLPSTVNFGLPLNETTIAEQLKVSAGYATGMVGKWHLGQREIYLPGNRGFDYYLGIPYSDDMGDGVESSCSAEQQEEGKEAEMSWSDVDTFSSEEMYRAGGFFEALMTEGVDPLETNDDDLGGKWLPLVYQAPNQPTRILEQPLEFTTLAQKYNAFALKFVEEHKDQPFFLYMPLSHVHTTSNTAELQYSGCNFKGTTKRGRFGDALAESDWIVGNVMQKLKDLNLEEDTLVLFTSDNGPWMIRGLSAGSHGLFTGRYAGYWNTGKGSNWEGGIRMPAFAYWKGKIAPMSRSAEIVSSMDVFPTLSALADIPLPTNRVYDGLDMSNVLLGKNGGKSDHDFLFFYGYCSGEPYWTISSVRHGKYKAHWCTMPGLGLGHIKGENITQYDPPLLFNIDKDPSEAYPISFNEMPTQPEDAAAMQRILKAYAMEKATFEYGRITPEPDQPGEGPGKYGVCCDRSNDCHCNNNEEKDILGIFNLGTKEHHDRYHKILGEKEPMPPRTRAQKRLQNS